MTNLTNTGALADCYAGLKHEESLIKARLETVRAEILDAAGDASELVGDAVVVALVSKKGSTTLDKDGALALLRQLGATEDQIAGLMKTGKPSVNLMVKPRLSLAV